ncbi:MAG: NAD(P)/FAD-dependent oxidoreductase [Christensenellaceae bacterium]|nr:NAD(P)/FAD-dependent oxidoreductase [Christensenellaceae bacterium]
MFDVLVIGAGVVGCAVARELSRYALRVAVAEAGPDVACGASKANSAIVHAGYDCEPGTNMARLNVRGNAMFGALCEELAVPLKRTGSLVLAFSDEEMESVRRLYESGLKNGVPGLKILDAEACHAMQEGLNPEVKGALYAPTGGITSPYELTIALFENARQNGTEFFFESPVLAARAIEGGYELDLGQKMLQARYVVNAAGLYADQISALFGDKCFKIHARKGEYILFDRAVSGFAKTVLFQAPGPLGKGVLVAPTVHGNAYIGPTAVEQADKSDTSVRREAIDELSKAASRSVPTLPLRGAITLFAGLRAMPEPHDFIVGLSPKNPRLVQAAGICSPGLTSAPAIAEEVAKALSLAGLDLEEKTGFDPIRREEKAFREMNGDERAAAIAFDPAYGRIICRCETVPEAEILRAIRATPGVPTLDGVKRRARAGMGRCQGGFCSSRVLELIARERNIPMEELTKSGGRSKLLVGRTREDDE